MDEKLIDELKEELGIKNIEGIVHDKGVSLRSMGLTTVPPSIFKMVDRITWLDLSYNKLESIPKEIQNLKRLHTLCLYDNHLDSDTLKMLKQWGEIDPHRDQYFVPYNPSKYERSKLPKIYTIDYARE